MSKTFLFRTLNLTVRLILVLNLLLSFVPAPLLHSLGRSSGVGVAHAVPVITASKTDTLLIDNDASLSTSTVSLIICIILTVILRRFVRPSTICQILPS